MSDRPDPTLFAPEGGWQVRLRDLSGANGSEPLEVVGGFPTLAQANAFARRYVRDSVERCRTRGATPEAVLETWFAFGEDAEVAGAPDDQAWRSATELHDFARRRVEDPEERNWRILDPRRDVEDDAPSEEDDA